MKNTFKPVKILSFKKSVPLKGWALFFLLRMYLKFIYLKGVILKCPCVWLNVHVTGHVIGHVIGHVTGHVRGHVGGHVGGHVNYIMVNHWWHYDQPLRLQICLIKLRCMLLKLWCYYGKDLYVRIKMMYTETMFSSFWSSRNNWLIPCFCICEII